MNIRYDQIAEQLHLDASETTFFTNQLVQIRRQVYEKRFPELKAFIFLPPEPGLNPGATHYTYNTSEIYGSAALGSDLGSAGPRADVVRTPATPIPFRDIVNSYGYNIQEIRSAMMVGNDLVGGKAYAARKAMEQFRDNILLLGDGTPQYLGLYGLFKLPGTLTYTIPAGMAGSTTFALKTPDEVGADLHGMISAVISNSNEIENPNTLILPTSAFIDLATRRIGDGSNMTILDFFQTIRNKLRAGFTVETSGKLETAGANGTRRMVAYERTAEKVVRLDSVEFEQFAPQVQNFETTVNCHSRTAGVASPYPKSIIYADGF